MKKFEKITNQGYKILEIWKSKLTGDYFVIIQRKRDISWGAFYNLEQGYWSFGHYDYNDIATARLHMLNMYKEYQLDLYKKF